MKRLLVIAMVIGIILGGSHFLSAEEPQAPSPPSGSPVPRQRSTTPPMSPAAMMGLMGAMPKPPAAGSVQEQSFYPMFQMFGPSMTGNTSITPEAMGTLITMQGEMMIKMGEVLMKYGQIMSGKTN